MNKFKHLFLFSITTIFLACGTSTNENKNTSGDSKDSTSINSLETRKNILFFGNSLTAGLGVETEESYPSLIQNKIDSLNLPYMVTNAGLSGETTAAGKARVSWILKQKVDVFVLELGANDGLRGIPVAETKKNLQSIIDQVKQAYPEAKLLMTGMEVPPNMGNSYASEFRIIFRELAVKNNMELVPFLLQDVGGVTSLNQADGIHPNVEGHKILADNVWEVLKKML